MAWFPLLLYLWETRVPARMSAAGRPLAWRSAVVGMGCVFGLGLLAGHTQSSYISLAGLAVYAFLSAGFPWSRGGSEQGGRLWVRAALGRLFAASWQLALVALIGLAFYFRQHAAMSRLIGSAGLLLVAIIGFFLVQPETNRATVDEVTQLLETSPGTPVFIELYSDY